MIPDRLAAWLLLALVAAIALLVAAQRNIGGGYDELAHASYTAQLQKTGEAWPALETLRMVEPKTFRFTAEANYLNHPPLYYWISAQLGPSLENAPGALFVHRFQNVVIALLGLAALIALGLGAEFRGTELYAYAIPLALIPVLPSLAGSINNDNAAFAGGALATLGAFRLLATGRTAWLLAALAGMVIAALAKLTGLLLAGGLLAGTIAYLLWRGRLQPAQAIMVVLAGLIAVAPYVVFVVQYGSPAPDTPAQIAHIAIKSRELGWSSAERLSFPVYVGHFLWLMLENWMPLGPRGATYKLMLALPLAAGLAGLAGLAVSARRLVRREERAIDVIVVAGFLALAATLALHIAFSYGRHLASGSMLDAYPRYYLPLAAVIPLAGLSLLSALPAPRQRLLLALLIAGPVLFRLFGAPVE